MQCFPAPKGGQAKIFRASHLHPRDCSLTELNWPARTDKFHLFIISHWCGQVFIGSSTSYQGFSAPCCRGCSQADVEEAGKCHCRQLQSWLPSYVCFHLPACHPAVCISVAELVPKPWVSNSENEWFSINFGLRFMSTFDAFLIYLRSWASRSSLSPFPSPGNVRGSGIAMTFCSGFSVRCFLRGLLHWLFENSNQWCFCQMISSDVPC